MSLSTTESRDEKVGRLAALIASKGSRFNELKLDQLLKLAGEADVSIDIEDEDGVSNLRAANGCNKRTAEFPVEETQVSKRRGAIQESLDGDSQRPVIRFPPEKPIVNLPRATISSPLLRQPQPPPLTPAQPMSWAARMSGSWIECGRPTRKQSEGEMTETVRPCHLSLFSRTDADRISLK